MYLFNPDNDLALAHFGAHYTPPESARKIASDLAILPIWFAENGAKIVAGKEQNADFLHRIRQQFNLYSSIIDFEEIPLYPEKIIPWGWNPALRKKLIDAGVDTTQIPSLDDIATIRNYSGRQNAVKMLGELKKSGKNFCGESYLFNNVRELLNYLSKSTGDTVLKMPYSGSGKGLIWIKGDITDKQTDWCKRVIREQGCVVAEPVLNKVQDFAMEFYMEGGKARFVGYSLFQSAVSGAYAGNQLMPDEAIVKELLKFTCADVLFHLKTFYETKLREYFPLYKGFTGIDMMICETSSGYAVQPCVEINTRMNMGVAAHTFYRKFVAESSSGIFKVDYFKKTAAALDFHQKMTAEHPLVFKDGKIKSGYFSLTPVSEATRYVAFVVVGV